MSDKISAFNSWRPSRVPSYLPSIEPMNDGGRFAAFSYVVPREITTSRPSRAIRSRAILIGRGVVLMIARGRSPSRKPICSMSKNSERSPKRQVRRTTRGHAPDPEGDPALQRCRASQSRHLAMSGGAWTARIRGGSSSGKSRANRNSPETITSRPSAAVGATIATRRALPASISALTYSAPVRVFPNPRPATSIQIDQLPGGGSCDGRAIVRQSDRDPRRGPHSLQ